MSDLRKLLDEATPGPWSIGEDVIGKRETTGFVRWIVQLAWDDEQGQADARLIAMAPDLAAALLKAEEALAYYRDQFCEGLCRDVPPGFTSKEMEIDCSGCRARATLTEIRKLTGAE